MKHVIKRRHGVNNSIGRSGVRKQIPIKSLKQARYVGLQLNRVEIICVGDSGLEKADMNRELNSEFL